MERCGPQGGEDTVRRLGEVGVWRKGRGEGRMARTSRGEKNKVYLVEAKFSALVAGRDFNLREVQSTRAGGTRVEPS